MAHGPPHTGGLRTSHCEAPDSQRFHSAFSLLKVEQTVRETVLSWLLVKRRRIVCSGSMWSPKLGKDLSTFAKLNTLRRAALVVHRLIRQVAGILSFKAIDRLETE